jgi:hypothetical protein
VQEAAGRQAGEAPVEGEVQLNHLLSIISHGDNPKNHEELLDSPFKSEWIAFDLEELNSHQKHNSWSPVPRDEAASAQANM